MNFTILSWFTKNTQYEEVFNTYFRASMDELNLDYKFIVMPSQSNWTANTNLKPQVIEQALNEINGDILLVDADAKIQNYPSLFDEIPEEYDMALHYLDRDKWYNRIYKEHDKFDTLSGTLFFRNRKICKDLIAKWKEYSLVNNQPDQENLKLAIKDFPQLKIYSLPVEYCWISSMPNGDKPFVQRPEKVYIEHFQISRVLRSNIRREVK